MNDTHKTFDELVKDLERDAKEHPIRTFKYKCIRGAKTILGMKEKTEQKLERSKRGFSIEDTWSFDFYLAKVISEGVRELQRREIGYPTPLRNIDEWRSILNDIATPFEKYMQETEQMSAYATENLAGSGAWELLQEWFGALWD